MLEIETRSGHDVVIKRVTLINSGSRTFTLPRAFGPAWELPIGPGAMVHVLAGDWAREFTPYRIALPVGELSIGSRQGITSHIYAPVVGCLACASDPDGPAYGIALAWSGSWRLLVDACPSGIGFGWPAASTTSRPSFDSSRERRSRPRHPWRLRAGRAAGVRRRWHDYQRSWLARDLDVHQASDHLQLLVRHHVRCPSPISSSPSPIAPPSSGSRPSSSTTAGSPAGPSDRTGLGNWWPDPVKFPDGLDPLISGVLARGMRFGIWVEPEAVSPDADILRRPPRLDLSGGRQAAGHSAEPVRPRLRPSRGRGVDRSIGCADC